ncbi:hypothetical protein [Veronia nyctiphanis]
MAIASFDEEISVKIDAHIYTTTKRTGARYPIHYRHLKTAENKPQNKTDFIVNILTVTSEHLELVAPLFDQYRVFYGHNSNLSLAGTFLSERLKKNESVIFLA